MLIHYILSVIKKIKIYCEICSSHGRDHEDHLILKCDAMWFDRWVPLYQMNVLSPWGQWWRQHIPPKLRSLSTKLRYIVYKKMVCS
jgi:hypothetical protein